MVAVAEAAHRQEALEEGKGDEDMAQGQSADVVDVGFGDGMPEVLEGFVLMPLEDMSCRSRS